MLKIPLTLSRLSINLWIMSIRCYYCFLDCSFRHKMQAQLSRQRGDFLKSFLFDWSVSTPGKAIPLCLNTLSVSCFGDSPLSCPLGQRMVQLTCSGTHTNSETPPASSHFYSSVLPTAGNCQSPWNTHTNSLGTTLVIDIHTMSGKLWQVKVQRLTVTVADCKNVFQAISRQALDQSIKPSSWWSFSKHRILLLPNRHSFGGGDRFSLFPGPRNHDGIFTNFSPFLTYFYTICLHLGGAWVALVIHTFVIDRCKILSLVS